MDAMLMTGYFGIPDGTIDGRGTPGGAVHVVRDGKPVCGTRISPRAVFQWCAPGIQWSYIECKRCGIWARAERP